MNGRSRTAKAWATPVAVLALSGENGQATIRLIKSDGLDRVSVSCDSLLKHRFAEITLRDALDEVMNGLEAAAREDLGPIKINAVVMRGINDDEIEDSIERAYYVTLGLAYEGPGRLAGSAFEPLLKKCDFFMRRTIENAHEARQERAGRVLEANTLVKEVIAHAKEMGAFHQYFQYQLISSIDPFKRKRGRQNFDELFDKAIAKLEKLNADPDRIRRLGGD